MSHPFLSPLQQKSSAGQHEHHRRTQRLRIETFSIKRQTEAEEREREKEGRDQSKACELYHTSLVSLSSLSLSIYLSLSLSLSLSLFILHFPFFLCIRPFPLLLPQGAPAHLQRFALPCRHSPLFHLRSAPALCSSNAARSTQESAARARLARILNAAMRQTSAERQSRAKVAGC